jgi:hypothetical protein
MLMGSSQKGQLRESHDKRLGEEWQAKPTSQLLALHLPKMEENEVRLDAQLCIHCNRQLLW